MSMVDKARGERTRAPRLRVAFSCPEKNNAVTMSKFPFMPFFWVL